MPEAIECEWNGRKYPSIHQMGEAEGFGYQAALLRVRRGYKCDADMRHSKRYLNQAQKAKKKAFERILNK